LQTKIKRATPEGDDMLANLGDLNGIMKMAENSFN